MTHLMIDEDGGCMTGTWTPRDPDFKPPFDHPSLEPVLGETLGVILYQEQVLQAAG